MNRFDPAQNRPSESIRSEIDETRQRMNTTIDALTERLKGRHLVDELLGFLRSGNGSGTAANVKTKVAETTSATVHAVVDTVKAHPIPVLVMGAGLAWLIYEKNRRDVYSHSDYEPEPRSPSMTDEPIADFEDYSGGYTAAGGQFGGSEAAGAFGQGAFGEDEEAQLGSESPGMKARIQAQASGAKERAQQKARQLAGKASELSDRAKQGIHSLKERTAHATAEARQRTRDLAVRTKHQVTHAAQEHPLETGLTCLAVGLVAGLLAPTPQRIRREVEPVAQRIKERAREAGQDLVQRGKRVVAAASDAARAEGEKQGLTPEAMMQRERTRGDTAGMDRPKGDWPGQDESASPPTPSVESAVVGDEQRGSTGGTTSTGLPPLPPI